MVWWTDNDLIRITEHYGKEHQKKKAIEELMELARELVLDLEGRGDDEHLTEEMADVLIMVNQLRLIYGNEGDLWEKMGYKIARTLTRMEKDDA